jgi:hypothetical protein
MPTTTQNNPENSTKPSLAKPEAAERLLLSQVPGWQEVLAEAHPECGEEMIFSSLLAALEERAAQAREVAPWQIRQRENSIFEQSIDDLLEKIFSRNGATDMLHEPHLLGWFVQAFHSTRREESFAAHTTKEAKHSSAITSTQLYTPRWCADFMAKTTLEACAGDHIPRVCDPCVGGGQMLLAALDVLAARHPDSNALELAGALHGVDLDERAVDAARRGIFARMQELRETTTHTRAALKALLSSHITDGDGLHAPRGTFDVVLTNPPYMGSRSMPPALKKMLSNHWRPFHHDLYTAFMHRAFTLAPEGRVGLLAQQTIWYLSRFEDARDALLKRAHLTHFVHLGHGAFAALSGEKANVVITLHDLARNAAESLECEFIDLRTRGESERREALLAWSEQPPCERDTAQPLDSFSALPGKPLAHWLAPAWRALFKGDTPRLGDFATVPGSQNKTGKNSAYIKPWKDVPGEQLGRAELLAGDAPAEEARWFFYSKGGKYSPWWGNWNNVVDWSEDARAFYKNNRTSNLLDERYWLRQGLCYTDFGGRLFNARWMPAGCLFDMAGPAIFVDGLSPVAERRRLLALLAVLNSSPTRAMLNALNPSLHYQVRDVRNLPLPDWNDDLEEALASEASILVHCVRALHLLVEDDPLFSEDLKREGASALERARSLSLQITAHWSNVETLVCEAHGVPELTGRPPTEPHHILSKLGIQ